MEWNSQIKALIELIDDPDEEIFDTVSAELMSYGKDIIPNLEQYWQTIAETAVQQRIELLIHRVQFADLERNFSAWCNLPRPSLLEGALLVAKYQYPGMDAAPVRTQFEKIKRNIWLELNNYLSPLEQINVFNSILYNYYKLLGHELSSREPDHFFINKVLETRQGNAYSLGILYLAMCELMDVPVFAVHIPKQFLFAYIHTSYSFLSPEGDGVQQIQFYIDPTNGMVYAQTDIDNYLRKLNMAKGMPTTAPLTARKVIYKMLEELALCYQYRKQQPQAEDMGKLMDLIYRKQGT